MPINEHLNQNPVNTSKTPLKMQLKTTKMNNLIAETKMNSSKDLNLFDTSSFLCKNRKNQGFSKIFQNNKKI